MSNEHPSRLSRRDRGKIQEHDTEKSELENEKNEKIEAASSQEFSKETSKEAPKSEEKAEAAAKANEGKSEKERRSPHERTRRRRSSSPREAKSERSARENREPREISARLKAAQENVPGTPALGYAIIAVVSALLSLTFYAFPFFNNLATTQQSQNLYSGLAMQHGLTPYNDFFGTGGSLFYLINWIGNFGGGTLLLWIFELLALILSGCLVYHLVVQQTKSRRAGTIVAVFTLISIAGLARGGDAPTLIALPLALWCVKFLDHYFRDGETDKGFIRFGMAGAAIFVIAPIMTVFFVFSALALLVYNVTHRRVGRGFYQMISALFGVLVVGYLTAYYALNAQTLYTSIEQSVLIPFTHYGPTGNVAMTFAKGLVLLLIFGLAAGFVQGVRLFKTAGRASIWTVFMLVGALIVTLQVFFAQVFDSSNLLAVMPFVIMFAGPAIKDADQMVLKYLQNRLFAPILGLIFVVGTPFVYGSLNHSIFTEEKAAAAYVKANTTASDRVYVVGTDKNINTMTREVASIDNVPGNYPVKFSQNYDLQVSNIKDKYIILESGVPVSASVKTLLATNYQVTDFEGNHFMIYQKK